MLEISMCTTCSNFVKILSIPIVTESFENMNLSSWDQQKSTLSGTRMYIQQRDIAKTLERHVTPYKLMVSRPFIDVRLFTCAGILYVFIP